MNALCILIRLVLSDNTQNNNRMYIYGIENLTAIHLKAVQEMEF